MVRKVYAIYDSGTEQFSDPMIMECDADAKRAIDAAIEKGAPKIMRYSTHLSLWYLCEYDNSSGLFSGKKDCRKVLEISDALNEFSRYQLKCKEMKSDKIGRN